MLIAGYALIGVGGLISLLTGIWILVIAFKEHIGWGIGCLLCAPVGLVFVIMNWGKAGKPFLIGLVGWVIVAVGYFLAGAEIMSSLSTATSTSSFGN